MRKRFFILLVSVFVLLCSCTVNSVSSDLDEKLKLVKVVDERGVFLVGVKVKMYDSIGFEKHLTLDSLGCFFFNVEDDKNKKITICRSGYFCREIMVSDSILSVSELVVELERIPSTD